VACGEQEYKSQGAVQAYETGHVGHGLEELIDFVELMLPPGGSTIGDPLVDRKSYN
jgi:hypothetical protein